MLLWIPLLPFAGFLINNFGARALPKKAVGAVASLAMLAAFGVSVMAVRGARLAAGRRARDHADGLHVDRIGRLSGAARAEARSAVGADDSRRHRHRLPDSPVLDGVHDRRGVVRVRALLRVPESLRRLHAAARARRQLHRDVRRLGRRGALFVSAHRLLVPEPICRRRRQEGVHRQPHRRRRVHSRRAARLHAVRHRSTSRS